MKKERFDASRLIELARQQRPGDPWLAQALAHCTKGYRESRAYIHFVAPDDLSWEVTETVLLDDRKKGDVVVDVFKGQRIGGVEFLKRL